jgi:pimeloyl-ACP methyl ester carboxylesterase
MSYYRSLGETQTLDEAIQASTGGEYVQLTDGITHYELAGLEEAQTVVLVHGFSIPYQIWDPVFVSLRGGGFRVLRFDLYGRGTSAHPRISFDQDLFDRQLLDLFDTLKLEDPVDLIGLSMGGSISAIFCARHPEKVRRLVLIDPTGFQFKIPIWTRLLIVPHLGERVLGLIGEKILRSSMVKDFYGSDSYPEYVEIVRQQIKVVGYRQALLSTIRKGMLGEISEIYRQIGNQKHPVLLIWGTEDRLVPFKISKKACEVMPNVEFHPILGAGHIPHYEKSDVVNPIILEFLQR